MIPSPIVVSDSDPILKEIALCVRNIQCSEFFSNHIGKSQSDQKALVARFQSFVLEKLKTDFGGVEWSEEYCPSSKNRDAIDVFGKGRDFSVVIEIDKYRADQVAKKFVSRMALFPFSTVYFI